MRIDFEEENECPIDMAPLIDCVFLLLIFFLVTTMMKKWEMQIPLSLPESTSSLSQRKSAGSSAVIALGTGGAVYELIEKDAYSGKTVYRPVGGLAAYLTRLKATRGTGVPLEIAAGRSIPVEQVIGVFDACQLAGFMKTRVRLGSPPDENRFSEQ